MTREVISFEAQETLLQLLDGQITRLTLLEDKHDKCEELTLWFSDGHGVAVTSGMHDVADRLEVGVLRFKRVYDEPQSTSVAFPKTGTPQSIQFPFPQSLVEIWKLTISEGDFTCESGLKIVFEENKELVIVPSAFPCHLSVFAQHLLLKVSAPEYPVTDYEQTRVI